MFHLNTTRRLTINTLRRMLATALLSSVPGTLNARNYHFEYKLNTVEVEDRSSSSHSFIFNSQTSLKIRRRCLDTDFVCSQSFQFDLFSSSVSRVIYIAMVKSNFALKSIRAEPVSTVHCLQC
jgi:hypothetical protein